MGIGAALIGAAGAVGGAAIASSGAQSAASTQANAASRASQTQLDMFNQTRASLQPFINSGQSAVSQLAQIFGFGGPSGAAPGGAASGFDPNAALAGLTSTPGYQFGLKQGMTALDQSAAAQGTLLSGSQLEAAQKFGTDYYTQQAWNPYISQLDYIANQGQSAAAGVGQQGTQAANNAGTAILAGGAASAAGQASSANILGQATTQLLSGLGSSYGTFANNAAGNAAYADFNPTQITGPVWTAPTVG